MAINYVRFQRGTQKAFNALKAANQLDNNTLYFIENEDGTSVLYMGSRLISGSGETVITPSSLKDLIDVVVGETGADSFLVKNADDQWVYRSLEDVVALIQDKLEIDSSITEEVSSLKNSVEDITEDIELLETSVANKADLTTVNIELAKKANIIDVTAELNKKANTEEVTAALALKADANTVNEALALKANAEEVDNALALKADAETVNTELAKKADVETVNAALALKADASAVYTKEEVNTKITTDISAAIAGADHLKRIKVDSVADIDPDAIDAELYIYMVPTGLQAEDDKYDEYIVIDGIVEKVGSWEVDLSDYAKKTDLDTKVNVDDAARLMTLVEGDKLAGIESGAQVNIINSISSDFTIDAENNKQLILNALPISKITNLAESLNKKVDAKEGYTLLSPDDQKKLSKLVISDDQLEISGTVNADNVQGLAEWLNKNAGTVEGLSENNLTDELYTKLTQNMLITSIDTSELKVSEAGQLSIIQIDKSKVTGLEAALNAKANQSAVDTLSISIDNISKSLSNYVLKDTYNQDIAEIRDILTWKEMV